MSDIDWFAETQRIVMSNLPTVHRSNYVAPDVELVIDPLLDFEPACEGPHHATGKYGHAAAEGASFLNVTPCCGHEWTVCASWVKDARHEWQLIECIWCGVTSPSTGWSFSPLPSGKKS